MLSQLHDALVTLFRNRPTLAVELLREALNYVVPAYTEARIESADFTQLQPAEYRCDLVVVLHHDDLPVLGVIVEVQLKRDPDKRFSWPVYATTLRRRLGCATCVLVFSPSEKVARWAHAPIELGAGSRFLPLAIGPVGMPRITDPEQARREPELSVLSAMAHGRGEVEVAIQLATSALAASAGLDDARSVLYFDLVMASLGPAARKALMSMDPAKYEFQSEFAKRYIGIGKAEGRAATLLKLLAVKNLGPLDADMRARIQRGTLEELEAWAVRVLTASSLEEVFSA
jgi:hypothetical protein